MATVNGKANVNRPVDSKLKEADVNRKLQFYGIASAFQSGKVPSVRTAHNLTQSRLDIEHNAD